MKLNKNTKQLAKDLGLSEIDAYIMDLKSSLYRKSADLINSSNKTHEEIAKSIGTSRSRISRIANFGENNISIELLIKLITILEGKPFIKFVA